MLKNFRISALTALLLLCLVLIPAAWGMAAKRALLVGVGEYPHLHSSKQLEGPAHDVAALADLLKTNHGFPAGNIVSLVDGQATKSNVLSALENLVKQTNHGDLVLIYFSGHGTSTSEYGAWEFDASTGALLPYNFKMDKDVKKMMDSLIIGRRDLRPILEKLDQKGPQVLAVFDACYSGFTIRSSRKSKAKSRHVPLHLKSLPASRGQGFEPPEYPYQNIVYMSAASSDEQAWDITQGLIWDGKKTFDNKPHGALTDSLLHAAAGDADTNGDGDVTCNELYHFTKTRVTKEFSQTPQLLHAKAALNLLDAPIFDSPKKKRKFEVAAKKNKGPIRVKLESLRPGLEKKIAEMGNVSVVSDGDWDLLITPRKIKKRGIRRLVNFYLPSGALLDQVELKDVVARIQRQIGTNPLIDHAYSEVNFNVFLELIDPKGVLVEDDPVGFIIRSEADAYILLINIESTGAINVLYPYMPEELSPVQAGQTLRLPELGYVSPPNFGVEHVKVFAFKEKPNGVEDLMGESFNPGSPLFDKLMKIIDAPAGRAAQAVLQVKTAPRSDLVMADGNEGAQ